MGKTVNEKCTDERRGRCLLLNDEDGSCRGLSKTDHCTFFKDKTEMTPDQIDYYMKEKWMKGYNAPDAKVTQELIRKGEKIREEMGICC